jgi:hypothetical protein
MIHLNVQLCFFLVEFFLNVLFKDSLFTCLRYLQLIQHLENRLGMFVGYLPSAIFQAINKTKVSAAGCPLAVGRVKFLVARY